MKSSNIGGQAVLEGIMMKNRETYSVAVRKPDGEIEVDIQEYKGVLPWKAPQKIPFIRGIFNILQVFWKTRKKKFLQKMRQESRRRRKN